MEAQARPAAAPRPAPRRAAALVAILVGLSAPAGATGEYLIEDAVGDQQWPGGQEYDILSLGLWSNATRLVATPTLGALGSDAARVEVWLDFDAREYHHFWQCGYGNWNPVQEGPALHCQGSYVPLVVTGDAAPSFTPYEQPVDAVLGSEPGSLNISVALPYLDLWPGRPIVPHVRTQMIVGVAGPDAYAHGPSRLMDELATEMVYKMPRPEPATNGSVLPDNDAAPDVKASAPGALLLVVGFAGARWSMRRR